VHWPELGIRGTSGGARLELQLTSVEADARIVTRNKIDLLNRLLRARLAGAELLKNYDNPSSPRL
jgi:hypothetical protein